MRKALRCFSTLVLTALWPAFALSAEGSAPIAATEPTSAPATPQPASRPDPVIQQIVSDVSQERVTEILRKLESFGTRNTFSSTTQPDSGIGAARAWILDQFKSYSPRLEVSFDTYKLPKGGRIFREVELRNVVAILPGKTEHAKDRWIVVSGHYDSVNLRTREAVAGPPQRAADALAPGVSDDGSGTACVMECARVLSGHEFNATLVFVAFAGEEQGLLGAKAMASRLHGQKQEIEAVLNNDIIGTDVNGNGMRDDGRVLVFSEDPNDSPSRQLARFVQGAAARYFPPMKAEMVFRYDRFARGGDHSAFNGEGYPAVRITTPAENFANQHSPTDTLANASPAYATRVIRINAAAAALLAMAPAAPMTIPPPSSARTGEAAATSPATTTTAPSEGGNAASRLWLTRGGGYDAVLRWDYSNPEPDLAGFIVVMRSTTAADWEKEFWAGNVRRFTLPNVPIDQVVLGVKAVDNQGHEGPVSAYINPPREPATQPVGAR